MNKKDIGSIGEQKAGAILESLGFTIFNNNMNNKYSPQDITATKDGRKYAINVKYTQSAKGTFGIQSSNIPRLLEICRIGEAIMCYLLIGTTNYLLLTVDGKHSKWGNYLEDLNTIDPYIPENLDGPKPTFTALVDSKGRIVVPKYILKEYNLKSGDGVEVLDLCTTTMRG